MESFSQSEIQFSPSFWSKRFKNPEEVLEHHLKFISEESNKVRSEIPCRLNIPYGDLPTQTYDLFGIDLSDESPIFVFVHGGYWQQLSKTLSSYVAPSFYLKKIKTIVIDYTLCPNASLQNITEETEAAFTSIISYANNIHSTGVYLAGHSAGGHLIATLFNKCIPNTNVKDLKVLKSITLISGVFDLTGLIDTYINEPLKLTEDKAIKLSPLYYNIEEQNCKRFTIKLVVGEYESDEFKKQLKQFYFKLKYFMNDKVSYKVIQELDHFDIVEKLNKADYELCNLIIQ